MKRLALALVLLIGACSTGDDAAPIAGGEFQLVAPGGQVKLRYPVAERKPLQALSGESLLEPGKTVNLGDYAGKIVVVNIWGSWCPPCRTEAPELQKIQDAGTAQVLGLDVKETSPDHGKDFLVDRGLNYPSIYDPSGRSLLAFKGLSPNAVPSTFILDEQHRVAAVFLVGVLASDLEPIIAELAAESSARPS
ncbi:TlpA family protein disulfide reductase [Lentzea tibetensis]|uniref:TlpA family protein disulfide reductase n=1 Tax=Lentzea tibetensis TaxID=2591470 RepID=A0A563EKV8_9PSEU|nr:TlpA disulfide reductase family protein [Lentzea tibetensis]TWP47763.1 TlpA family protein disulfide reductase [Lentzea tibetensis]